MTYTVRVIRGWENIPEYDKLCEYVIDTDGHWIMNRGGSHIDGRFYPPLLSFVSEEDLLVCKLRFSEMVYVDDNP